MKRYFMTIASLFIMITFIQGCQKEQDYYDTYESTRIENNTSEDNTTDDSFDFSTDTEYGIDDLENTSTEENFDLEYDVYSYVNETIYYNLLDAKKNFKELIERGRISKQMRKHGNKVGDEEGDIIDDCVLDISEFINDYIAAYEKNDVKACCTAAEGLCDVYREKIDQDYLYSIMIKPALPKEYRGEFQKDAFGNIDAYSGEIYLKNGRSIKFIGQDLDFVTNRSKEDLDMYDLSEWYKNLPSILSGHYSLIKNENEEENVCYIWNDIQIEKDCDNEWNSIKEEGASDYDFDSSDVHIQRYDEGYFFEDQDGEIYGELTYDQSERVDHIYEVQDALVEGAGDVYVLDSFIRDMEEKEDVNIYTK